MNKWLQWLEIIVIWALPLGDLAMSVVFHEFREWTWWIYLFVWALWTMLLYCNTQVEIGYREFGDFVDSRWCEYWSLCVVFDVLAKVLPALRLGDLCYNLLYDAVSLFVVMRIRFDQRRGSLYRHHVGAFMLMSALDFGSSLYLRMLPLQASEHTEVADLALYLISMTTVFNTFTFHSQIMLCIQQLCHNNAQQYVDLP
jgi:hypothetical protein